METFSKFILVLVVIMIFLAGILIGIGFSPKQYREEISYKAEFGDRKVIELGLPAVDSNGNSVVAMLRTTVRPGSGLVLVNINDILAQYDTQYSGRIAAKVAGVYTNTNMSTLDIIYNIEANASIIEGPSAGAAMAASIILALEDKEAENIMITGTIDQNRNIGRVGSVYEKALAAKQANATLFLVPVNQSKRYSQKRNKVCEKIGLLEYCRIEYIADDMNIGEIINLTVKEVSNIEEVMDYFLKE